MMRFEMTKIELSSFKMIHDVDPKGSLKFKLKTHTSYNTCDRSVCISAFSVLKKEDFSCVLMDVSCHFTIQEGCWYRATRLGVVTIPKEVLDSMVEQTLGVARGVFYCKAMNTKLRNVVLPLVCEDDPTKRSLKIVLE